MAEIYNAGRDIMDAYFKGKQIRQGREKLAAEQQIAYAQLEARNQQLEQAWKIHEQRLQEQSKYHNAQIAKMQADFDLKQKEYRVTLARGVADGILKPDLENPGDFISTEPGTREQIKNKAAVDLQTQLSPVLIQRAIDSLKGTQPIRTQAAIDQAVGIDTAVTDPNREDTQAFTAEQNRLNREARRGDALLRARATLANKGAAAAEKAQVIQDLYDSSRDDIFNGSIGLDDPSMKGSAGIQLIQKARTDGIKILNKDEKDKLDKIQSLKAFYNKAAELNNLLSTGTPVTQAMNPRIKQLQEELSADIVVFGREAKAEKGVVTDKDVPRLEGAVPKILPGGFTSLGNSKARKEANQRRVNDILNIIYDKTEGITKNMDPIQRKAVFERYNIPARQRKMNPDAEAVQ